MQAGFVYLDEAVPGVFWEAKYAGADNFTGAAVDGYRVNRVVGSRELAAALIVARDLAGERGYRLLLWDAYRPERAVRGFMRWANAPEDGKTKEAHYPRHDKGELFRLGYIAERSGHSRGGTVDLTLTDQAGVPIDMGGEFDLMDERSHHGYTRLSEEQIKNRALLKSIMERAGFAGYENEWWHYRLIREPYPNTYFDFPIE